MKTIALLAASNVFMTTAWYGHLRFRESALWKVILVSWLLAFFEYCLQVPANRIGYGQFTAAQLKIIQEVITLFVFVAFAGSISASVCAGTRRSRSRSCSARWSWRTCPREPTERLTA